MEIENNYTTRDLAEASFLHVSRQRLVQIKNDNSGRCWFVFADNSECKRLANAFWYEEPLVNARDFYNSMRTLKDLIFNRPRK